MTHLGSTLLCTVKDIKDTDALRSVHNLKSKINPIIEAHELDVKHAGDYQFKPYGVSIFFVLGSSHLAVHTWPEQECLTLDIHLCSEKGFNISSKLALDITNALDGNIVKQSAICH